MTRPAPAPRIALAAGVLGAAPGVVTALSSLEQTVEARLAIGLGLAVIAASLVGLRRRLLALGRGALEPRHVPAAVATIAIATLASTLGTVAAVGVPVAVSLVIAFRSRGAFARGEIDRRALPLASRGPVLAAALFGGVPIALWVLALFEDESAVRERVVWCSTSPFQRIALTEELGVTRLFLDGQIQVSSDDEAAYHETLVHPAAALVPQARSALVLGGGDGLVVRELLLHASIARIVVVDIDAAVTTLARFHPALAAIGGASLSDPRVELVHDDALAYLACATERFDLVVVDLPDPTSEVLAPLYAKETFERMGERLAPKGVLAVQAGSPRFCAEAFASIVRTLESAGFSVRTGATDEPRSFGGTAVALAARDPLPIPADVRTGRWLGPSRLETMFRAAETELVHAEVTTLARPAVLEYLREAEARRRHAA